MTVLSIPITAETLYKILTFNVVIGKNTKRFRMEIRHLTYTDKWYISIFDAQSGEAYCRYIPVVASYSQLNNLIGLFEYKDIGWMACIPKISKPSSADPQEGNIDQFEIVWGDTLA